MSIDEETVRERQRRVTLSGGRWEEYVRLFLNEKLEGTDIKVVEGKSEERIKKTSPTLWRMLSLPLKASTSQESTWGDIDLVAIKGEIPIVVISCKTSLHGRFTETLFWSLLYRMLTRIKVVLATPDAGSGEPGKLKSEWGTPENPNNYRLLAESYIDGVYVENVTEFCKLTEPTALGGIVRPLSELPEDLKRWTEESSKFTYIGRSGLRSFF
jgi:hypothetical protein